MAALADAQKKRTCRCSTGRRRLSAAAISLAKGRTDLVVDLPIVRAMLERALVLDEGWSNGSLHELMITIESQGEAFGGSEARARQHFDRAVALQMGRSPGPYVALAMNVSRASPKPR